MKINLLIYRIEGCVREAFSAKGFNVGSGVSSGNAPEPTPVLNHVGGVLKWMIGVLLVFGLVVGLGQPVAYGLESASRNSRTPAISAVTGGYAPASASRSISSQGAKKASRAKSVKMYRLYNLWTGEHFYTSSLRELRSLVSSNWLYEGIGWYAPKKSTSPVYRLFDKRLNVHHYTMAIEERNNLRKKGWRFEGIGWYSDDNESIPVYRQFNSKGKSREHNFTFSKSESDQLREAGWKSEGVGWYAVSKGRAVSPRYTRVHWEWLLSTARSGAGVSASNGSISERVRANLSSYLTSDTAIGFIGLNEKTGKVIACNADMTMYGASTVKAPFIASLCKYDAPGVAGWQSKMYDVITYSSNELYHEIAASYGNGYLDRLADESDVSIKYVNGGPYAEFTPRDLAKLWATMDDFMMNGSSNADLFKGLFGNGGFFKEGWMFSGMLGGQLYHVAGAEGDCVYAIMTGYSRPNETVWALKGALLGALAE